MTDFCQTLASLRRPRLLIRAARLGVTGYNRNRDLKRITNGEPPRENAKVLRRLMAIEADLEQSRQDGEVTYSPARHVDILIALIAEAQLWLRVAAPT
ncbi:DUF6477 family protein [Tropicimonas marinistellae]|uniref:DUF6477 family protein n=1 Tax=Tropicimonas marinistellae TaxID=1739787 RepID=UPI00083086F4|nr:DUF6477 family protein [Tropicimonas marinistellae]